MKFEKSFDTKELGEALKAKGMPLAEEAVKELVHTVLDWTKAGCQMNENALVKAGASIVDMVTPFLDTQIEKIYVEPTEETKQLELPAQ